MERGASDPGGSIGCAWRPPAELDRELQDRLREFYRLMGMSSSVSSIWGRDEWGDAPGVLEALPVRRKRTTLETNRTTPESLECGETSRPPAGEDSRGSMAAAMLLRPVGNALHDSIAVRRSAPWGADPRRPGEPFGGVGRSGGEPPVGGDRVPSLIAGPHLERTVAGVGLPLDAAEARNARRRGEDRARASEPAPDAAALVSRR